MKVNYSIKIDLSPNNLKDLLKTQKSPIQLKKIQMLYWLKTRDCETMMDVSRRINVHVTTLYRWFNKYKKLGLHRLLENQKSPGRPKTIPAEVQEGIKSKLQQKDGGVTSYKQLQYWVQETYQFKIKYRTLHHYIREQLKTKLKVPKRCSTKKIPKINNALKKTLIN